MDCYEKDCIPPPPRTNVRRSVWHSSEGQFEKTRLWWFLCVTARVHTTPRIPSVVNPRGLKRPTPSVPPYPNSLVLLSPCGVRSALFERATRLPLGRDDSAEGASGDIGSDEKNASNGRTGGKGLDIPGYDCSKRDPRFSFSGVRIIRGFPADLKISKLN